LKEGDKMINNNFEIKHIPDQAINLIENDLLGTSVYVETLEKIIKDSDIPHTIGLFGSWGSGKSSIIKTLHEKLKNDESSKVKVFIYDAWKYSKDDFRRTFILQLARFIYLNDTRKIDDIESKLYKSVSTTTKIGISKIFNFEQTKAIQSLPIIQPELFEELFNKIVNDKKCSKLVIAIDNIDRCHKEQAFEILLTIKNFLEIESIIFLIPIDDNGLKKYLQMNDKDTNEFLRKLFNTTVHLKSFSYMELYDFGLKLVDKYGIDFPKKENVISLVCQEFSKNPRRIVQFLNTLQTEYQLAKIQEEKGLIPEGAITKNIEMLVKILIIREEYPEIFEKINDSKGLLKEIHESIRAGEFSKTENGLWEWKSNKFENIKLTEEQYRFFLRTLNIEMDKTDLEPFFLNKDVFKDVPDKIYQEIISQDWENLKEALKKNEINFETLISFIDKQTNEDIIKRKLYDTSGFNLASLIFKIIADAEYGSKFGRLSQNIIAMLNENDLYKHIYKFPTREFAIALKWLNENNIQVPLKKVIDKLNELKIDDIKGDKSHIHLITGFIKVFKDEPTTLEKFRDKFSELLSQDFALYSDFKEIIDSEAIKHLLNDKVVINIIQTMQQDYNQNYTKEKVEIIKALNRYEVLNETTRIPYLSRAIWYVGQLQAYQNWDIFSFWLEGISGILKETKDQNVVNSFYNNLANYNINFILQQFNNRQLGEQNIKVYKSCTNILGELYLIVDDQKKQNIVNWLNTFLNPQISRDIFSHINRIYQEIIQKTDKWLFTGNIINQMVNQNDPALKLELVKTINLMMERTNESRGLNDQQVKSILSHYFDLSSQGKQEANGWIIGICQNDFIANKVFEYSINMNTSKLEKNIEIIKVLTDKFDFDKFYPKIRELLASSDVHKQQVGVLILYHIKNKIPGNKRNAIMHLLNEIKEKDLTDNAAEILNELKDFFQSR
jgi:hypothetical protein